MATLFMQNWVRLLRALSQGDSIDLPLLYLAVSAFHFRILQQRGWLIAWPINANQPEASICFLREAPI